MTQGTLSDPRSIGGDTNDGKQIVGHVDFVPTPGLVVGSSFALGPYLDRSVASTLPAGTDLEDFDQMIFGVNSELSFGHLNVIAEWVRNVWTSPFVIDTSGEVADLTTTSWYVEGRYAVGPGTFLAGRMERMGFGSITDGAGGRVAWDDDVDRAEGGIGYYLTDRTIGKLVVQYVDKKGPGGFREAFPVAQLSLSF